MPNVFFYKRLCIYTKIHCNGKTYNCDKSIPNTYFSFLNVMLKEIHFFPITFTLSSIDFDTSITINRSINKTFIKYFHPVPK